MNVNVITPAGAPARAPLSQPMIPPPRILVVDDDEFIRRLNTKALAVAGYAVDAAKDGADAWEALNTVRYDLLITDNTMANVTGMELIGMIHAHHLPLPVIMASGTLPTDEFARHPALTPAAMLCKPYLPAALMQTVRTVLDRGQSRAWDEHRTGNGPFTLEHLEHAFYRDGLQEFSTEDFQTPHFNCRPDADRDSCRRPPVHRVRPFNQSEQGF